MKPELREALGKAVYYAMFNKWDRQYANWDRLAYLTPNEQESYRRGAEAAVEAFIAPMISIIHQVSDKLAERDPEMQGYFEKVMERFEELVEPSMMQEGRLTGLKNDLLSWAGLHRGKAIAEEAMPRFHEIIDTFEHLVEQSIKKEEKL